MRHAPVERSAHVVQLHLDAREPFEVGHRFERALAALGERKTPSRMASRDCFGLAAFYQTLACVLARRLEQPVALVAARGLGHHERFVDQGAQQGEYLRGLEHVPLGARCWAGADFVGRLGRPAVNKNR